MNRLAFALAMFVVVAAAAWAYHINYRTKNALARVDRLRAEIAAEREALDVLRVEWAYLNAPQRLAALMRRENRTLGLVPLAPRNFDEVAAIPYPVAGLEEADSAAPPGAATGRTAPVPVLVAAGRSAAVGAAPLPAPRPVGWIPQ